MCRRSLFRPADAIYHGHVAERPAWLDEMAGRVRCPACGGGYGREALRVVGQRGDGHWIVRCSCRACGSESMAAVHLLGVGTPIPLSTGPCPVSLTVDDVLRAHEILKDYRGNIDGLFGAGRSRERRG